MLKAIVNIRTWAALRFLMSLCLGLSLLAAVPAVTPGAGPNTWTRFRTDPTFKRIAMPPELSQSTVFCSLQDSRGLMWFGTDYGLNLYDGQRFRVFHHTQGRDDTISADWINCLLEDPRGYLWVGTMGGGLTCINLRTMAIHSTIHDPEPTPARDVTSLTLDLEGNLWVGTQTGLYLLPKDTMPPAKPRFTYFPARAGDPHALPDPWVTQLLVDHRGTLWLGTEHTGLCKIQKAADGSYRFTPFHADPSHPNDSAPTNVESIVEDALGVIWLGSTRGLYRFLPEQRRFRRFLPDPKNPFSLSHPMVWRLLRDSQQTIWVATNGGGLHRMLPRQHAEEEPRLEAYRHEPMNPQSLASNGVISLYEDRAGTLWVGSYQTGLSKLLLDKATGGQHPVAHFANKPLDPKSLSGDMSNVFLEDHDGNLWVGTDGSGLNRAIPPPNPNERLRFDHFRAEPGKTGALQDDVITALYEDRENRIWAGSYNGGLIRITFPGGSTSGKPRFTHYRNRPGDPTSLSSNFVTGIYQARDGSMWIATVAGGLNAFDPKTGTFKTYNQGPETGLSSNAIYSIAEDRFGTLWLGSHPGINRFNPKTGKAHTFLPTSGPGGVSHSHVFAIYIDAKDILWAGTSGGGLNRAEILPWNGPVPQFRHFGTEEGLPSEVVKAIAEDHRGNLWISTSRALCRFNPQEGRGHAFPWRPELEADEFIRNACQVFRSGELAFGSTKGFCIFKPDDIIYDATPPAVAITDLKFLGKSVPVGVPVDGRIILSEAITECPELVLRPRDYSFSLDFASLHFVAPERNQYAYMMEGLDKTWTRAGNRNTATYTTLPPGNYRFRVIASNSDGSWNLQGATLRIRVLPPWWRQWWFLALSIGATGGLIYLLVRMRLRVLRNHNRLLEEMVAARTQELADAAENLRNLSLTDPLTGLSNRRYIYACMPEDVAQVQRLQHAHATNNIERLKQNIDVLFVLVDMDHFKVVNDTHGHVAGDRVLQQLGEILRNAVRGTDTAVRWGGEEFLVVARSTARADATILPERIRSAVEAHPFDIGTTTPLKCTCSIGFSVFPFLPLETDSYSWEQIIDIADHCLYAAKHSGRNAWVGMIPDGSSQNPSLSKEVGELIRSGEFKATTSLKTPIQWEAQ